VETPHISPGACTPGSCTPEREKQKGRESVREKGEGGGERKLEEARQHDR